MAAGLIGPGRFPIPQFGITLDLASPIQVGYAKKADVTGSATWSTPIPSKVSGMPVWAQGLQNGQITNLRTVVVQ